ncbi:MAG: hypothetical protein CFE40_01680 [Burkholderiales bacterium PBB1]|nr:MAG: hypothetical protein CFE40_01680 [Burkholderiales bacterium PBB1]
MKVCFLYNAQLHQIPHSLPIALELSARHPEFEVDIAGASVRHLDFARRLCEQYGINARLRYHLLERPWYVRLRAHFSGELAPHKKQTLVANVNYLSGFDAVVTPERTSLSLRRSGRLPARTRMVYTGHGAGDRAMAVTPEIREFDFVFTFGEKLERRRLDLGLIRPGAYATGVYAKFDWVLAPGGRPAPLFANGRPTVLYSPHFDPELSSWPEVGWQVLDHFAQSPDYNLVFAPHVRLFEPPTPGKYRAFRRYAELPHMLIDLGSERSIDMSYTLGADAYIGDVSSQVAEFMLRPRPCLFLNPRGTAWQGDPNYRFWTLGPVLDDVSALGEALRRSFETHADYSQLQQAYFAETFGGAGHGEPSARRGADLLAEFLRRPATA